MTLFHASLLSCKADFPWMFRPFFTNRIFPVEFARNECVRLFLEDKEATHLFFMDDDLRPPANWAELLNFLSDTRHAVSGFASNWNPGKDASLFPCAFNLNKRGDYEGFVPKSLRPVEVDAVGTGCVILSRPLLEQVGPHPYAPVYGKDGRVELSEDLGFWRFANDLGHRPLLVPAIEFGHDKLTDLAEVRRYSMNCVERGFELGKGDKVH